MKLYLHLLASVLVLASCSTAYKTGQTPDDVYYSPVRQREEARDEYARVEKRNDRYYQNEEATREDRYLRMRTSYRRYSLLDDCDCYCYNGGNYYGYNNYYRSNNWWNYNNGTYVGWNVNPFYSTYGYYNPHYYNPYYSSPYASSYTINYGRPVYNKPRGGNPNNSGYENNNYRSYQPNNSARGSSSNTENYNNSGKSAGGFLRDAFSGSNNNSGSSGKSSSSSTPPSSSSSGSSGSSPAPVRKF